MAALELKFTPLFGQLKKAVGKARPMIY